MLAELLTTLAAAGGTAVVQAAGTEAWGGVRDGVVRLFRRGPGRSAEIDVEGDLERTALIAASGDAEGNGRLAGMWQEHFSALLDEADDRARQQAVTGLWQVITSVPGVADRYPTLHVYGNTYDKSPQQYGSHNHMVNNYGSDT
jgi:hypothetical protein